MIYLDNAATTFPKPEMVLDAVDQCQRNYAVNVGRGTYSIASHAAQIVDETRMLMATMVNANGPETIVFAPSATIAANEIILGLPWDQFKTVYVSPFEHNSVMRPLHRICSIHGLEIKVLPFSGKTQVWDKEKTVQMFEQDPPDYVFLNHVSNVTGVVLPIQEITEKAKAYGACVVVDASQSMGLIKIDIQKVNADYYIFAGHKNLYASWGIGGFVSNANVITPFLCGGTGSDSLNLEMGNFYPSGFEPGSPNIIAISSLQAALRWLVATGIDEIHSKKAALMNMLIQGLKLPNVQMYLPENLDAHTSVLSFNLNDYEAQEVGFILNHDFDIAVRTGFHCAPFVHDLIGTRERMGTVRVSVGYFNSEKDIQALISAIREL